MLHHSFAQRKKTLSLPLSSLSSNIMKARSIFRTTSFGLAMSMLFSLTACSYFCPPPIPRGALLEKDEYSKLIPGSSTRSDVITILGTPTTHATFNDNTWIYVAMTKDLVPLSFPAVDTQEVLVLNFDNHGTLQNMKHLGKKDAIYVDMASGVTKTPGTQISIIQELLGNVGRYNPLSSMGSTFGGMGGINNGGGMGGMSGQGTGNGGVGNTMP